jgi:hypothetical protein
MRLVKNEPLLLSENVSDLNTAYKMISKPKKEKVERKDPFTAEQRETILKMVNDFLGVLITESGGNLRAAIDLVIEKLREAK